MLADHRSSSRVSLKDRSSPEDRPIRARGLAIGAALAVFGWTLAAHAAPPTKPLPADTPTPQPAAPTSESDEPATLEPDPTSTDPAEPTPAEPTPGTTPAAPDEPVGFDAATADELQQRAETLEDALFKARARISIVSSKLYGSKLGLQLRSNVERFYTITDFSITVDGAPIFDKAEGLPPQGTSLFELFAAPGAHQLGVSATLRARRDPTYTVTLEQTFTIVVPPDSNVSSKLVLRETGNMWRFGKRRRGQYRVSVRLMTRAKKIKGRPAPSVAGAAKP